MKNPKEKTFNMGGETFLTITGMAEALQCNPQTVQRKVAQLKISHFRHKNRLLFPQEAVGEYIKSLIVNVR